MKCGVSGHASSPKSIFCWKGAGWQRKASASLRWFMGDLSIRSSLFLGGSSASVVPDTILSDGTLCLARISAMPLQRHLLWGKCREHLLQELAQGDERIGGSRAVAFRRFLAGSWRRLFERPAFQGAKFCVSTCCFLRQPKGQTHHFAGYTSLGLAARLGAPSTCAVQIIVFPSAGHEFGAGGMPICSICGQKGFEALAEPTHCAARNNICHDSSLTFLRPTF